MSALRVAIIGAGNIAATVHLPAYQEMGDAVQVIALCDTAPGAAERLAGEWDVPGWYTDFETMLETERPDVLSLCVPNRFHREMAVRGLEAGCHVFCEKPPAMNAREAQEMHEAAKHAGRKLSFNFAHRFSGPVEAAREALGQNRLGEVYSVRVQALRRRAIPGWGVFTNRRMQGGGPLIDIGVHMLDAALWLLGFPKPLYAMASASDRIGRQGGEGAFGPWRGEDFTVEDGLFGFVLFEGGLSLRLETAFALHRAQQETTLMNVDFYGDLAGLSLSPCKLYTNRGAALIDEDLPHREGPFAQRALQDFIKALRQGGEARVTSENALPVQRLVDALYQSAAAGKPVSMEEVRGNGHGKV